MTKVIREVQEALGRLGFLAGPLTMPHPFLGPVYAWVAACPPGARGGVKKQKPKTKKLREKTKI